MEHPQALNVQSLIGESRTGMDIKYFHVDSFADEIFSGNPAGVCVVSQWLPLETMHKIAAENALPETAFVMKEGESYHIRWFTPDIEMDLCGHATLAAAFVIGTIIDPRNTIVFQSRSGELAATLERGSVALSFPRRVAVAASAPEVLLNAVSVRPSEVYKSRDYIFLYDREELIRKIEIERELFDTINLDPGGLCVTAAGDEADFVSRYFTPQSTILEDPVTGSAHCSLIPLWSERLGKKDLVALQLSARGGRLLCRDETDRVRIAGNAVIYEEGLLHIP